MDASFAIGTRRSGCCELIELSGELDMLSAPQLRAVLDQMLAVPDHLVIDTTELTFVDSAVLRVLLHASALVGGRIELRGANFQLRRLLEITMVAQEFCLAETPEVAHRTISGPRKSISV